MGDKSLSGERKRYENTITNIFYYPEDKVKEFIQKLKNRLRYKCVEEESFISFSEEAFQRDIIKEIDKLAGKELI